MNKVLAIALLCSLFLAGGCTSKAPTVSASADRLAQIRQEQDELSANMERAIHTDTLTLDNLRLEHRIADLDGVAFKKRMQEAMVELHIKDLQNFQWQLSRNGYLELDAQMLASAKKDKLPSNLVDNVLSAQMGVLESIRRFADIDPNQPDAPKKIKAGLEATQMALENVVSSDALDPRTKKQ